MLGGAVQCYPLVANAIGGGVAGLVLANVAYSLTVEGSRLVSDTAIKAIVLAAIAGACAGAALVVMPFRVLTAFMGGFLATSAIDHLLWRLNVRPR
jgi:hypothetical protein